MKYDSIIIGGGLSGLVAGLRLIEKQKKVAIFSLGQSALHFSSGSMGFLGVVDGKTVGAPLDAVEALPELHPYRRIGKNKVAELAGGVKDFFAGAGISLKGCITRNSMRLSPMGVLKPAWLTLDDFVTLDDLKDKKKCTVVNFKGFLDFYPGFLAESLETMGIKVKKAEIVLEPVERLRKQTELRATSIGRALKDEDISRLAAQINAIAVDSDIVLVPAVIGYASDRHFIDLRARLNLPVYAVATTPMSVCGMRVQTMLRRRFEQLGGTYFLGDRVEGGAFDKDGRLGYINTVNLGEDRLHADNFILATGGFFGHGLVAEPKRIFEPVFGLDVDCPAERDSLVAKDFFGKQPYMGVGLTTDSAFHPSRNGKNVANLYAVGAVLGGYDALKEDSGAGVAIITALNVAERILNNI